MGLMFASMMYNENQAGTLLSVIPDPFQSQETESQWSSSIDSTTALNTNKDVETKQRMSLFSWVLQLVVLSNGSESFMFWLGFGFDGNEKQLSSLLMAMRSSWAAFANLFPPFDEMHSSAACF